MEMKVTAEELTSSLSMFCVPGSVVGYSDWLRAGRSGDRIPVGDEIFRSCPDRPWSPPSLLYNGYCVFPGGKERPGRKADPSSPSSAVVMEEYSYNSTPPMGRTACTEPQCLYKGALYLYLFLPVHVQTEFIYHQSVLVYGYSCKMMHLHLHPGPGNKKLRNEVVYRNAVTASEAVDM